MKDDMIPVENVQGPEITGLDHLPEVPVDDEKGPPQILAEGTKLKVIMPFSYFRYYDNGRKRRTRWVKTGETVTVNLDYGDGSINVEHNGHPAMCRPEHIQPA